MGRVGSTDVTVNVADIDDRVIIYLAEMLVLAAGVCKDGFAWNQGWHKLCYLPGKPWNQGWRIQCLDVRYF
jgi:hypothetical protein